jgi:hypothetical protein
MRQRRQLATVSCCADASSASPTLGEGEALKRHVPNRPTARAPARRLLLGVAALIATVAFPSRARAQGQPPPPGYAPPPGYYGQPPPGYYGQPWAPPGYYGQPPIGSQAPSEVPLSPEEQRRSDIEARSRLRNILGALGVGALLGAYGTGIAYSSIDHFANGKKAMWIPVAGPWLTIGTRNRTTSDLCAENAKSCPFDDVGEAFKVGMLLLDGVGQLAGVALITTALALSDLKDAPVATVTVAPYARPGAGGLVFAGTF